MRKLTSYRSYRSSYGSYRSSYRPYGSDDGYDYARDNRDGHVEEYARAVEEWRKNREKNQTPNNGG